MRPGSCSRRCLASVLLVVLFNPVNALAGSDADRISELEKKLEQSLKQMEVLSAKIKQLEASSVPNKEVGASADAQQNAKLEQIEQRVAQLGNIADRGFGNVPLHGFADVGMGLSGKGGKQGFSVGAADFYFTPKLGDNVLGLVELIFEVEESGELLTDLERIQLGYVFSDAATLWMGRFHTPYGYWNTGYHHGQFLQASLKRPRFIDFEDHGGILPSHSVGAWLTGSVKAHDGKVSYDLYVANAPRIGGGPGNGVLDMNNAGSTNHNASVGFNAAYNFAGNLEGLKLGLHGLKADVRDDAGNTTGLQMLGGYVLYDANDWETLAEYYSFENNTISSATGSFRSWAGFAQVGRTFNKWTPYARLEKAVLDQNDLYFSQQASGRSYGREAFGVRYKLNENAALKLEFNHTRRKDADGQDYNEAQMQYAIRF